MTTRAKKPKTPSEPPQLYRGAESCDFRPVWVGAGRELAAMLDACHAADPDDLTPTLALADMLAERGDARERWVRLGCELWGVARATKPGCDEWVYEAAKAALEPVCRTIPGWRLSCLWGHLVAWHAPSGVDGKPMGRTWVDARVGVVNRCVWWWAMGLIEGSQLDAAGSQAYAAGNQANAAGNQAYAAWCQAYAAGNQANAAGSQADAARSQAYAAGNQANAAEWQADAAEWQAYTAGRRKRVWSFARRLWEICAAKLPLIEQW